ncbi:DUF3052 family protein [Paucibacter sp. APW11]|uniref:DUF3052 family protein n=1 Tax=Roseateles aquae TaxID=3077235 RepID=A0ABU3PGX8_9BURK|nr:DUF3052 family protein [Paucibacter sp. APW11]MDT9001796.1 DUF3052 family protein [Paucibacter sp. APW11]
MTPSGYSGTPLAKKLGLKPGMRIAVMNAPEGYGDWLAPLPPGLQLSAQPAPDCELLHWFLTQHSELVSGLPRLLALLSDGRPLWVSWPKKAARKQMPSDIDEDAIRAAALPLGLVDIKVCAVSEIWSGLKLVLRRERRG